VCSVAFWCNLVGAGGLWWALAGSCAFWFDLLDSGGSWWIPMRFGAYGASGTGVFWLVLACSDGSGVGLVRSVSFL
jgi:hypothetical protein